MLSIIRQGSVHVRPFFLAVVLTGFLSGCDTNDGLQAEQPPRPVKAVRVADPAVLTERTFPGRASAAQEVNLSFRVSGPLIALAVKVGDEVEAGDTLAQIDPRDFEVQRETVAGQLESARAKLKVAELEFDRAQEVRKRDAGLISQSELDKRQGARDAARANVSSLQSTLTTAEDNLAYTTLKSPFDGVVVATYVDNFEDVLAKQPILRLLDPARLEMTISVPEGLIGYAGHVERIGVRFDTLPGVEVEARIKEIGREASVATRTYPVTLTMEQPEGGEILPGMAGKAQIHSKLPQAAPETGIEIPAQALFTETGTDASFVWIIEESNMTVVKRAVEVGLPSRFGVLVRDGIEPGELLITAGVHSLEEGRKVRIPDEAAQR
jgi:RND family efflux transporter MFP subunit